MQYITSWPGCHIAALFSCQFSLGGDVIIESCLQAHQQLPSLTTTKLQNLLGLQKVLRGLSFPLSCPSLPVELDTSETTAE